MTVNVLGQAKTRIFANSGWTLMFASYLRSRRKFGPVPLFLLKIIMSIMLLGGEAGLSSASARPDVRQAIIIGNSEYRGATLRNPVNDARLVAIASQDIGFEVTLVENASQSLMRTTLQEGIKAAAGADILMLYFAGHGVQVDGINYLLPVDIGLTSQVALSDQAISVSEIVQWLSDAGISTGIIFLDACRNNPFSPDGPATSGLSLVETGSSELVISYAAASGAVAYDGGGPNSPYSIALVEALRTPGIDLYAMLRKIRGHVRMATEGRQIPWASGSIEQSIVLHDADDLLVVGGADAPAANSADPDEVTWQTIATSTNIGFFEDFVRTFPDSRYASKANDRLSQLRALGKQAVSVSYSDAPILVVGGQAPLLDRELSAEVDTCDVLAAGEHDPRRMAPGVTLFALEADSAILACAQAIDRSPNEGRFHYQLARALAVAERWSEASLYAQRAADLDYAEGHSFLGWINAEGLGTPKNVGRAIAFWKEAAKGGSPNARANLGRSYRDGLGMPVSLPDALYWLTMAATAGERVAADDLGNMHRKGVGTKADIEEAMRWYYLSASLGGSNAMTTIANIYRDGDRVPVDPVLARVWYAKAMAAGNRFAPFQLARLELRSAGGKATPEITDLFVLAGDRGFGEGYLQASKIYAQNKDVTNAVERAYFYAILAADSVPEKAQEWLADLRRKLSSDRVSKTELEAAQWLEQNGDFARRSRYAK